MATVIKIPRSYMGQTMQEHTVKSGLLQLNPELHFDMGAALNIWHPYMDTRQNVFYRGRSIGAMDRKTLPEVPIWSMTKDLVEIPWHEVQKHEVAMYGTAGVLIRCKKCSNVWEVPHKPLVGVGIICPALCENMGDPYDATLFSVEDKPTDTAWVWRQVRDRVILVGWRHTFNKLMHGGIPGVTKSSLEEKFGVNLDAKIIDEHEIDEVYEHRVLDSQIVMPTGVT